MGSEKKRKRTSTDGPTEGTPSSLEKSERKKLKKLKNESMDNGDGTLAGQVAEQTTELVPLISPIATRKYFLLGFQNFGFNSGSGGTCLFVYI